MDTRNWRDSRVCCWIPKRGVRRRVRDDPRTRAVVQWRSWAVVQCCRCKCSPKYSREGGPVLCPVGRTGRRSSRPLCWLGQTTAYVRCNTTRLPPPPPENKRDARTQRVLTISKQKERRKRLLGLLAQHAKQEAGSIQTGGFDIPVSNQNVHARTTIVLSPSLIVCRC